MPRTTIGGSVPSCRVPGKCAPSPGERGTRQPRQCAWPHAGARRLLPGATRGSCQQLPEHLPRVASRWRCPRCGGNAICTAACGSVVASSVEIATSHAPTWCGLTGLGACVAGESSGYGGRTILPVSGRLAPSGAFGDQPRCSQGRRQRRAALQSTACPTTGHLRVQALEAAARRASSARRARTRTSCRTSACESAFQRPPTSTARTKRHWRPPRCNSGYVARLRLSAMRKAMPGVWSARG